MYNTSLVLNDGTTIYPGYLGKEERARLKEHFKDCREFMRCGCKPNDGMYYRISEDLKIYPEHNGYQHDRCCSRYRDENGNAARQFAYQVSDEDGEVTAYVTFNPKDFQLDEEDEDTQPEASVPEEPGDEVEEVLIEKREAEAELPIKKEPKLTLAELIRSINIDSFTERVMSGRRIESRASFSKAVFHRMKRVRIARMKKKVGELSLENDGVRFVYLKYVNAFTTSERGFIRCYIETAGEDGTIYKNLVAPKALEKAAKVFAKSYGIEPDENTMLAGFQYLRTSRSKVNYRILGRIHLFQISGTGIYSRSLVEMNTYNRLTEITRENPDIRFYIPPEDADIGAVIEIKGYSKKILLLFRLSRNEEFSYNTSLYVPVVVDDAGSVTGEMLYELLK